MEAFRGKKKPWEQEKEKKVQLFSNGEKAGMALCLAMLLFAISQWDVPLVFFSASFLIYEGYNVADKVGGERLHFLASLLRGLSLALFFGSILLVFVGN